MAGMVDFKLGPDNDLVFENGDLVLVDGAEACAQQIKARILTIKGELKWDTRVGFPHFELSGDEDVDLPRVAAWMRATIASAPGVISVSELDMSFDPATRELILTGEATYSDGAKIPLKETLFIEVK